MGLDFTHLERRENKKTIVREKLRELIVSGVFKEGDRLPSERELAQTLEVSRNILREAVISLASEGFLEVRERQGIFLKRFDDYGMIDALQGLQVLPADFVAYQMEVRMIIEVPAARLAAMRRTEEDIRRLYDCYEKFVACPYSTREEQAQNGKWEALLHHLVTSAAHNPILSRLNENINSLVERNNILIHPNLLAESGWIQRIHEHHATIIRAIKEQDPILAGDTLKLHMLETIDIMKNRHADLITNIPAPYWALQR